MAKRDLVYERIMEGGATREILMDLIDVDSKGLSSQMTYLRMMGKCPMKGEDGFYKIVSTEEWEAHKAASSSGARSDAALTPEQRIERAEKREGRAAAAADRAIKALEKDPDNRLKQLQKIKTEAELELASIMLSDAVKAMSEVPTEAETGVETGVAPVDEQGFAEDLA